MQVLVEEANQRGAETQRELEGYVRRLDAVTEEKWAVEAEAAVLRAGADGLVNTAVANVLEKHAGECEQWEKTTAAMKVR